MNKRLLAGMSIIVLLIGVVAYSLMNNAHNVNKRNVLTSTQATSTSSATSSLQDAVNSENNIVRNKHKKIEDNNGTSIQVAEKLKASTFSGKLEKVNTGCFADAECYVIVDGKHVTALRGWSRDTVGSVIGVDGFGDLEGNIGSEVEVYAQDLGDGIYTLYGSQGFYIKLK